MPDDFFDNLDRLRRAASAGDAPTTKESQAPRSSGRRVHGEFLKGPIPLLWLTAASKLSGKSPLAVGLALWFEAGRRRSLTVTLTTAILARFGVQDRKAKYRGLRALEEAGLIGVLRVPRRNPLVTIFDCNAEPSTPNGTNEAIIGSALGKITNYTRGQEQHER